MKVVHSWLQEYVGEALPDAAAIEQLLNFHSFEVEEVTQVETETIIDVDVLPNRSSDCLCHRGIARELASILNVDLVHDPLKQTVELPETDQIQINIADTAACPRFTATLITGVEVKESPDWLKQRLAALGVRSINNIVDATNYVMYAIGEPLHAYDADLFPQVNGSWNFAVRFARAGEQVSLLAEGGKDEDRVIECQGTELLIVDDSSDTPIGLAGVKGGRFAGVHAGTKNIIIEAAHFHPTITRKTARRLGIVIDASKRFENEPSRELPPYAQAEVIKLITDIAGGKMEGFVDAYVEKKENPTVVVTTKKTNALLGLTLTTEDIADLLCRVGATVEVGEENCQVTGPWERTDLNIEEDFIEEVGRLYGLDKIVSIVPESVTLTDINARQYYSDAVRQVLLELGFSEVITSSFHKKGKLQLKNALASDKSYVRGNLRKNIETALEKNFVHADLLGIPDVRIFEIGTVFIPGESSIKEHVSVALGVRTKGNGYSGADDKILQTAIIALEEKLGTAIDWNIEKGIAETNFSELVETLPSPTAYEPFETATIVTYQAPSSYPAIARDIALWVQNETADAVAAVLTAEAGSLLVRHTLFDMFEKDNRTSYAFRLVFQSKERTLTDAEINEIMNSINKAAADHNWEVR